MELALVVNRGRLSTTVPRMSSHRHIRQAIAAVALLLIAIGSTALPIKVVPSSEGEAVAYNPGPPTTEPATIVGGPSGWTAVDGAAMQEAWETQEALRYLHAVEHAEAAERAAARERAEAQERAAAAQRAPATTAPAPPPPAKALSASPAANRALGQDMAAQRGWAGEQFGCLDALWSKESGWNHTIWNRNGSGAYGIPQAKPAHKMASHGADWRTNPATQIAWGLDYIAGRYTTPCGAWSHSQTHNWY